MTGIYKITSPTGRVYIGQSKDIGKRFRNYKCGSKGQSRLSNSLKKYGWQSHSFEIVEECSDDLLDSRERFWQEYYNVLGPKGLNCVYVGTDTKRVVIKKSTHKKMIKAQSKRLPMSDEHKRNISLSWLSRVVTQVTKDRQSKAKIGKKNSVEHNLNISKARLGIKFSEATKQKLRVPKSVKHAIKLKEIGEKCKVPIQQFTLSGVFIKDWESASDAERLLSIQRKNISACCNNKRLTAGGYVWKLKEQKEIV